MPKRRHAAAARATDPPRLSFWRGVLRRDEYARQLVWSGSWVGANKLTLPSAEQFSTSKNNFTMRYYLPEPSKVYVETDRIEVALEQGAAYLLSNMSVSHDFSRSEYIFDDMRERDYTHLLRMATLTPDDCSESEELPMSTIAVATGENCRGKFVCLGAVSREAAPDVGQEAASASDDTSEEASDDASEEASDSDAAEHEPSQLVLTLARLYVGERDLRAEYTSPSQMVLPALLNSRELLAAPWEALSLKLKSPLPTVMPTAKGSPIEWVVEMPNPGGTDDAWVEGERGTDAATRFKLRGRTHTRVRNVSRIYDELPIVSWRQAVNRPAAFFPGGVTMGRRPSYHGSGCSEE